MGNSLLTTRVISHRGNVDGPDVSLENTTQQTEVAIRLGFDVEIDVWKVEDRLFLGHDAPQHPVELQFLLKNCDKLWVHAKNLAALRFLLDYPHMNVFTHVGDDFTLTSHGQIWTFPNKPITNRSVPVILVRPTLEVLSVVEGCYGICTDYPVETRKLLKINDDNQQKQTTLCGDNGRDGPDRVLPR